MKVRFFWMAPAVLAALNSGATPLSLVEAQRRAALSAPPVAAQMAALDVARNMATGAAELADPKLILGLENVPLSGPDRFSTARDSMTMRRIGLMQEFARGNKRAARAERAQAEVAREQAMLELARVNVDRDVALAWIERYFAERQLELLEELAAESALQARASVAQLSGAKGEAAESVGAQLATTQLGDRIDDARRMAARGIAMLRRWIGSHADAPLATPPDFTRLTHDERTLTHDLAAHPHLAMYVSAEAAAQADLKLAEAARQGDWSLEVAYGQRGSSYPDMLSIGVKMDLPIFQSKRQDPAAFAKAAELTRVRAQALEAERAHAAEIEMWLADWKGAKARVERFRGPLNNLARQRLDTTLAAYQGGKGELSMVLEARRAAIELRMAETMAEAELARAWAQLNFMLPQKKESP